MSNRNDPSFGSPTLPIEPDIRNFPLRPEPRLEDFPFIPVPEPHEDKIQVIFSDLSPEDYPLWLQPRGWKKWAVSLLAALPLAAVIIVILAVRASASFKDLFVGPVFGLFAVLFFAAWLLILFLQWLLKPHAVKAAEKKAASRIYQARRLQWQEETRRRKAEQERLYQLDKTRWLKEKEQRDLDYQSALIQWEESLRKLSRDKQLLEELKKRLYEKTQKEIEMEMDHLIESQRVSAVSDWIVNLFTETVNHFRCDNTIHHVCLDCLIRVEAQRILCFVYDGHDKKNKTTVLSRNPIDKKNIYDFREKRRANLGSSIKRVAMLNALKTKVQPDMKLVEPLWAEDVNVELSSSDVDPVQTALSNAQYAETVVHYIARNKDYQEIQKW